MIPRAAVNMSVVLDLPGALSSPRLNWGQGGVGQGARAAQARQLVVFQKVRVGVWRVEKRLSCVFPQS
jgi:hypothetical protein